MTVTVRDEPTQQDQPDLLRLLDVEVGPEETLSIAEVAELTGNTQHTLRYYERIGLVVVDRDIGGRRVYRTASVGRVLFITRLRASAMPIRDIHRYVELVELGDHTAPQRLALLLAHRDHVRRQMAQMQASLEVIDFKITIYSGGSAS
jgi:DNA-binding transcriptional MerR regulator